ncbi:MAG TPA: hypothetical protein VEI96_12395 [Thermodesulfovibrionales bacterium]|nr:hypothetical protein [Thermodesulfovibrionales bacterium]
MTKYRGGQRVGKGTYWNLANGAKVVIPEEGVLPGNDKTTYTNVSIFGLIIVSPIVGLFYVVAFPCIVIAEVVKIVGVKILRNLYDFLMALAGFEWTPNEAYLSGRKRRTERVRGKGKSDKRKSP